MNTIVDTEVDTEDIDNKVHIIELINYANYHLDNMERIFDSIIINR